MVKVLDIPMFEYDIPKAVALTEEICLNNSPKEGRCISATGASGTVYARQNDEFKKILQSFFLNLPDGVPSVWVGKAKGAREMKRCYGPDFFKDLMISSASKPIRHFLCGGQPGVAEQLKAACEISFGNGNIKGTYTPPFRPMSDKELQELGKTINQLDIDILWIGISTPKQEFLASRLRRYAKVHFIVTVGAAFDFHTGRVKQAPKWVQRNGLEWLFRLIQEPARLYKRYFTIVPLFIWYNLEEFVIKSINSLFKKRLPS